MLAIEDALARILARVPRLPAEDVPLGRAYGRILADDVLAPIDVPPWDNSAMDGYAVRSIDLEAGGEAHDCDADRPGHDHGETIALMLNEVVGAGGWPSMPVRPGTATAVMTGAPIPQGCDSVVMIEDTDRAMSGVVHIRSKATTGQHIRRAGADIRRGSRVLAAGDTLHGARVGLLASLGLTSVSVVRRPRIGILSTGDEIVAPGVPLGPGQIYSSNNAALVGLVGESGGDAVDFGVAPDRLDATVDALRAAIAAGVDALITTGGVSVGEFDYVKDAFVAVGGSVDFWKVAMKPGKPLAFGRIGDVPLFGLPGNPVSCIVNFNQFVRPWMRLAGGSRRPFRGMVTALAADSVKDRPGRSTLIRVVLEIGPDGYIARSAGSQSSGALSGMANAHGLAAIPADRGGYQAGDRLTVQVLDPSFLDRADPGYGWTGS